MLSSGIRVSLGLPVGRVDTGAELVSGAAVADLAAGYERQENDVALGSARGAPTTALAWRYFGRNVNSGYAELQIKAQPER